MRSVAKRPVRRLLAATDVDLLVRIERDDVGRDSSALMGSVTIRPVVRLSAHAEGKFVALLDLDGKRFVLPA